MTTGVLLQKIVSAKSLMEFTHVFIDEVSTLPFCVGPCLHVGACILLKWVTRYFGSTSALSACGCEF
jgi:hypothetical protein